MTNKEFITEFIKGVKGCGANGHLGYVENRLINYSTEICIIDRANKTAKVNTKRYSTTTSKIQGQLKYQLTIEGYTIEEYQGADFYPWNYGQVGAGNLTQSEVKEHYKV